MAIQTIAGTTISISAGIPATYNAAGYAALTYTLIGNIEDGGEHGREYNIVTFQSIDKRITQKFKGSYDEGDKTLSIAYDPADAGMVLLKTALLSDADYSFKVTYQDGKDDYFPAKVTSLRKATGGVDTMAMVNVTLAITSSSTGVGVVEDLA